MRVKATKLVRVSLFTRSQLKNNALFYKVLLLPRANWRILTKTHPNHFTGAVTAQSTKHRISIV